MQITHIDEGGAESWETYVGARASSVTDLFAWRRVVENAYGLRSHFLAATENGHIVGTLGLFEIKHPIFGHYLATAVFSNDGGLYFDSPGVRHALLAEARRLGIQLKVDYLLIRTRDMELDDFIVDRHYRTAIIDLDGSADAVWKRLPAKTRNQIRRGMKEGFSLEVGHDQRTAFYEVFHEHMRDLGSPAHGKRFYNAVVRQLGDRSDFLVVRDGSKPVAGALLFWINGTAMNYHTVSLRSYNRRCPNYLLYWKMIETSCARGCRWFDMGRSEADSSNLKFKANWGTREVPLSYNYLLFKMKDVPYLDPRNPKYRIAIAVWQNMPLLVTKTLGPRLISGLA